MGVTAAVVTAAAAAGSAGYQANQSHEQRNTMRRAEERKRKLFNTEKANREKFEQGQIAARVRRATKTVAPSVKPPDLGNVGGSNFSQLLGL